MRTAFDESEYKRLHILEEVADNPEATLCDGIAGIELTLEHGMHGNVSIDDLRSAVSRTLIVIDELIAPALTAGLIRRIRSSGERADDAIGHSSLDQQQPSSACSTWNFPETTLGD